MDDVKYYEITAGGAWYAVKLSEEDRIRALDALVTHAHWIKRELTDDFGEHYWTLHHCSNCDYKTPYSEFRYCPDCGAKMDEEVKQ